MDGRTCLAGDQTGGAPATVLPDHPDSCLTRLLCCGLRELDLIASQFGTWAIGPDQALDLLAFIRSRSLRPIPSEPAGSAVLPVGHLCSLPVSASPAALLVTAARGVRRYPDPSEVPLVTVCKTSRNGPSSPIAQTSYRWGRDEDV